MSAGESGNIETAAIAGILAASGVRTTLNDAEAVARAVARIAAAADVLFAHPSFDDTEERFFRLLETGGTGGAAA